MVKLSKNELTGILQNYSCLCSFAETYIRTSYYIGFGTITIVALVISVTIINLNNLSYFLLSIPIIFFTGGIIYCHVMQVLLIYLKHMMEIENIVNDKSLIPNERTKTKEIMILDISSKSGNFSIEYRNNIDSSIRIMFYYFSSVYLISAFIGLCLFIYFMGNSLYTFWIILFFVFIYSSFGIKLGERAWIAWTYYRKTMNYFKIEYKENKLEQFINKIISTHP